MHFSDPRSISDMGDGTERADKNMDLHTFTHGALVMGKYRLMGLE